MIVEVIRYAGENRTAGYGFRVILAEYFLKKFTCLFLFLHSRNIAYERCLEFVNCFIEIICRGDGE
jgi:hypothetical protein